jgi:hypothetical protein
VRTYKDYDGEEHTVWELSDFVGMTMTSVEQGKNDDGNDALIFVNGEGRKLALGHSQSCCESVDIESIVGDLADLVGEPILLAEEVTHEGTNPEGVPVPEYQDSFTWTFYKFATRKGYVDVRFYGASNGYYSESVNLEEMTQ